MFNKALTYLVIAIAFAVAGFVFVETGDHQQRIASIISKNLQVELLIADEQASIVVDDPRKIWDDSRYGFFLLSGGKVTGWSSNSFEPESAWFNGKDTPEFVRSLRGDFITRSWKLENGDLLMIVVPLIERYRITNRYLGPAWNHRIFPQLKTIAIDPYVGRGAEVKFGDRRLFNVFVNDGESDRGGLSLWCFIVSVISFITSVTLLTRRLHRQRLFATAFWVLFGSLIILRLGMIFGSFPAAWFPAAAFDSSAFASSALNPSIMDLVLNSIVVLTVCVYLLYAFPHLTFVRKWVSAEKNKRLLAAMLCYTIAFFGFLFPFLYFETIYHNSSITLDWTQSLFFDGPRIVAFLSVVVSIAASFTFCHVWVNFASILIGRGISVRFLLAIGAGALVFIIYYVSAEHEYLIPLLTASIYFVVLAISRWTRGLKRTSYSTFLYLIFGIICFALQASWSNKKFTDERTGEFQYRFGLNFLVERDVLGEYLLNEASSRIAQDPFIQSGISNPFVSRGSVRQKIRQVHLSSYFNRYDVQIHMFNSAGDPVDNLSRSDLADFVSQYKSGTDPTSYRGIYFVNRTDVTSSKRYVAVVSASRGDRITGYIILELSLKKIVPESVYPELLVDNRFAENFKATEYSYAIFQDGNAVSTFGTFNYETDFDSNLLKTIPEGPDGQVINHFRHIAVAGEPGFSAVVTAGAYPLFYLASNVAFWSLLGIITISLGLLMSLLTDIRMVIQLNYATRIQLYVFFAFMIPLVAVSVTTVYWTSLSAEEQLEKEFVDKTRKLADQLSPQLEKYLEGQTEIAPLQQTLIESTRLSGVDASVYSSTGHLIATNQVQIFDNLILSNLLNSDAFRETKRKNAGFIQEEQIGKLKYNNSYRLLRSEATGETLGVLSIPFFNSGDSLDRTRIMILSNIQIVFMIIFVFFTIVSFVITRWFTFPLRMITRSLSNTTLKQENKPLDWQSNDEIGWMVQEYNRMLSNLEKNKIDLARSQKESAWREMAQQVAHEIKNPLTPMKLTLQQMEMLLLSGSISKEKAEGAVKTLLAQLEILNDIATSFSSFAKMPAPLLHRLDLTQIVHKAVRLYAGHPAGTVKLLEHPAELFVMGDDQLLSRIFSNLILNALQSGSENTPVLVDVSIELRQGDVVVSFRDNGAGIDDVLRDKVFMPHFTTKQSGSGLGLAIAKQGVEQSGGSIWFETSSSGTVFYVSLPAVG